VGDRTVPAIITLSLVIVVFGLMWWGWRNRLKRQASVAPLPPVPAELGEVLFSTGGQYVVTTAAGDWLDRIAVHGLGIRTKSVLDIHPEGVLLRRNGAADLFIAKDALSEVTTAAGMAGKFVEKDGLVVMTWLLGDTAVDTGFRTTEAVAKRPLVTALQALLPHGGSQELPDADMTRKNDENE
jgi:hypothetical protein